MRAQGKISATLTPNELNTYRTLLGKFGMSPCQFNLKLLRWLLQKPDHLEGLAKKLSTFTHIGEMDKKIVEDAVNTSRTLLGNSGETNV